MASLIFAHSKSIVTRAKKDATKMANQLATGDDWNEIYNKTYSTILNSELKTFDEYLRVSAMLHDRYTDTLKVTTQYYFLTIRPDDSKCTFDDFYDKVLRFVKRKCFLHYRLSFEQKGTVHDELGKGFHVHIVAQMKQRSKTEVLRDTLSSWNDWIEKNYIQSNCIQVLTTKNPDKLVSDYLIEYKSDDEHKIVTKEMDMEWRKQYNLQNIYESQCDEL